MKIAIVHDYLNQFGGAERVVEVMHKAFPEAPIFTSIYLPHRMPDEFRKMNIVTSFMQKLPFIEKHFKKYFMVYPFAFAAFDLKGYDMILSSSSAYAKGVRVPKGACHVCYCYSPMRFAWRYDDYIEREDLGVLVRSVLPFFVKRLKKWDMQTNRWIDHFIAISEFIAKRIRSCYSRDSSVIYPSVDTTKFSISPNVSDYFLIVSRLNAYKKIDIAIKAFNELGLPLKIIGDGPSRRQLEKMAGKNIEFLGRKPDSELRTYYSECRAVIFPGEEDFGIVPVEAQAAGRPVIAYGSGGALETVIDGKTGVFFDALDEKSLIDAVNRFAKMEFDPVVIRANALRFDDELFIASIRNTVQDKYREKVNGKKRN